MIYKTKDEMYYVHIHIIHSEFRGEILISLRYCGFLYKTVCAFQFRRRRR